MKLTQRYSLTLLLGATASLAACDRANTPGTDRQNVNDFSTAPPARRIETDQDSVNGEQNVQMPAGKGSAADINTSTDAALNSAPSGSSATTPQSASGAPAAVNKTVQGQNQNATKAPSENSTQATTPVNDSKARNQNVKPGAQ
ncbi:hypothetical protein [Hymenobacter jejuensis]|uniref:Lipoprotein n=1 Tax=Hymenobacter jejuensis TaxID=2502781 RepID=A0A5B8A3H6_9BACT|nr:hypothetical protein [Hymenobacter jejuensis]QDA61226.1 hypothetical protein FHG12_14460 [Hymenobacter jejuensis]